MSIFRGQTATLQIDGVTVGALQDAEINPTKETEELTGQSIKREDIMQTSFRVSVSASYGNFDLSALKSELGYDDANNEIEDTPDIPTVTVTGTFSSTDGTEDFDIAVQNVVVEDITLSWDGDTHVIKDFTGEGDDIVITDNTA